MPVVDATLSRSSNPAKKFMVVLDDGKRKKTIHFGAKGMEDFTMHKDKDRRAAYLDRHRKNENWNDPYTAGFWSRHLLWNMPTLRGSAKDIAANYDVKIHMSSI